MPKQSKVVAAERNEHTVRQISDHGRSPWRAPRPVEPSVEIPWAIQRLLPARVHCRHVAPVLRAPTFPARAMSGRERDGLVEKEQLGVRARGHHRAAAAFELEEADQPHRVARRPNDLLVVVMQDAPVTHECAARWGGDDLAGRRHPVLQRQTATVITKPDT